MRIQIAGPGCPRCQTTDKNAADACASLGPAADISHVYDIKEYTGLGARIAPAVVVDGRIVISGKVPTDAELKRLLSSMGYRRAANRSRLQQLEESGCAPRRTPPASCAAKTAGSLFAPEVASRGRPRRPGPARGRVDMR